MVGSGLVLCPPAVSFPVSTLLIDSFRSRVFEKV